MLFFANNAAILAEVSGEMTSQAKKLMGKKEENGFNKGKGENKLKGV